MNVTKPNCPRCGGKDPDCGSCLPDDYTPSAGAAAAQPLADILKAGMGAYIRLEPQASHPGPSQAHPDRTSPHEARLRATLADNPGLLEPPAVERPLSRDEALAFTRNVVADWTASLLDHDAVPVVLIGIGRLSMGEAHVCQIGGMSARDVVRRLRRVADILEAGDANEVDGGSHS